MGRRLSHAQAACRDILEGELEGIREAGTWKSERVITSKQAVTIRVQGQEAGILNFCANNYLGLSVSVVARWWVCVGGGRGGVVFVWGRRDVRVDGVVTW